LSLIFFYQGCKGGDFLISDNEKRVLIKKVSKLLKLINRILILYKFTYQKSTLKIL